MRVGRTESWLQDPAELPKQTASSLGALAFPLPSATPNLSQRRAGAKPKLPLSPQDVLLTQTKSSATAARRELTPGRDPGRYSSRASVCSLPGPAAAASPAPRPPGCPSIGRGIACGISPAQPTPHAAGEARQPQAPLPLRSHVMHTRSSSTSYQPCAPSLNCNHTSSPNTLNTFHFQPSSC